MSKTADSKAVRKKPTWSNVKKALADYDRPKLIALISDLYASNPANKIFLHARFGTGEEALEPYLKIIEDSLYPDVHKNKPIQIAKGKKAITDYTRAVGDPKGILELMLCFVEKGANFTASYGDIDSEFYLALERMYDNALKLLLTMDEQTIAEYRDRFGAVVTSTSGIGWGFHDKLGQLFNTAFPTKTLTKNKAAR